MESKLAYNRIPQRKSMQTQSDQADRVQEGKTAFSTTVAQFGWNLRRMGMWEQDTEARRWLVLERASVNPV